MKFSRVFAGLITGILGVAALVPIPARAIVKGYNFSWEGDGGYSMEGMFSFDDATLDADLLVRESDLLTFMVDFFDPSDTLLNSYNLTNLPTFFNFNFEADTGIVRQFGGDTGNPAGDFGIIIGNVEPGDVLFIRPNVCPDGLVLFSGNNCDTGLDGGGEVVAMPKSVPEPASALGLVLVAGLGTLAAWKKRDIASKTEK